jgi:TATA-box binding protein (TBP) (component of TFIID and TFIIIB)
MNKNLKKFHDLPVSTQTVMVYLNCTFNIQNILKNIKFKERPLGNKNKKNFIGEYGVIYDVNKGNFRNQITGCIYIIDKFITFKIFPTGKFHLTGCKNLSHQQYASIELFKNILKINTIYEPTFLLDDSQQQLSIILEVVMVNIDFHIGFNIDQKKLDELLQRDGNEFYTIFESSINTSVNIKMDYPEPSNKIFDQIIITLPSLTEHSNNFDFKFCTTTDCPKSKKSSIRTHTFLVFSSSKVIQSGRYHNTEMEKAYIKFNEFINKNRSLIELKLNQDVFDMSLLKGIKNLK